jgi:nucleotidyltransferase substrate binding protein (TIGR01987 family)
MRLSDREESCVGKNLTTILLHNLEPNQPRQKQVMNLDFTPFGNAIAQLEKSLTYANSAAAMADPGLREQLRNSVIQCFEFTYELSWKMLKRYLEETEADPTEIDISTFQNLIRLGNERSLLRSDWRQWKIYRQARTDSSHTYDANRAEAVFGVAPDFLAEARFLFEMLILRGARQ